MKIKKILLWLPAIIFSICFITAAAKVQFTTNDLAGKLEQKVNISLYNSDRQYMIRELDQIQDHLKIIEEKIDGLHLSYQKSSQ